jgi:hypothetical protein
MVEREIPMPAELVNQLKTWKSKRDESCGLVFQYRL